MGRWRALAAAAAIGCSSGAGRHEDEHAQAAARPQSADVAPASAERATASDGPDGSARLPATVVPRRYALDLAIDPSSSTFTGTASIDVDVVAPTLTIDLHAEGMTISAATLRAPRVAEATTASGAHGGLRLTFDKAIPAGPARLAFVFSAPFTENNAEGNYRIENRGDRYVFTQFESIYARKAFPCFDEPGFKTPYDVTLRVPHGLVAVSNGPESSRTTQGAFDVVRFAPTPPIPSYLVAWAVGPWDVVAAPAGATDVPLRVIAPHGMGTLAKFTLDFAPRALKELTSYFGEPFPYAKLDLVAVPDFDWGGMENAGLIAIREDELLLDAADVAVRDRANAEDTIAHEMAHQWFGDMVTPLWWDDIWLNEAFATWMATRVVDVVDPSLDAPLASLADVPGIMLLDSRPDARAVRQPVEDAGDVFNAFDDITYGKGSRLLAMTEAWLGADVFRSGVRAFLAAHRYGSATSADLFAALEKASGKPVGDVLSTFLDRPGVPKIETRVETEVRVRSVTAKQGARWSPAGRTLPPCPPWRGPVFVASHSGDDSFPSLHIEDPQFGLMVFDSSAQTAIWNARGLGYYVWTPHAAALRALLDDAASLSRADRVELCNVVTLGVESGEVSAADAIDAMLVLAKDGDRFTVAAADGIFQDLAAAVDDATRPAFEKLVRDEFAPHLAALGLEAKTGEPPAHEIVRSIVICDLGGFGGDASVRAHCRDVTRKFLDDPASVRRADLRPALDVAAWSGDEALWDEFRAALDKASAPDVRTRIVASLAGFADARLAERTWRLLLDGNAKPNDFWSIAGAPRSFPEPPVRTAARWEWISTNFEALRKTFGEETCSSIPSFFENCRTRELREQIAGFFARQASPPEGTARNLALALAAMEENERRAARMSAGLAEYLARSR